MWLVLVSLLMMCILRLILVYQPVMSSLPPPEAGEQKITTVTKTPNEPIPRDKRNLDKPHKDETYASSEAFSKRYVLILQERRLQ